MFKSSLLALLFLFSLSAHSYKFDTVVTFGDSLSDNGNLYSYLDGIIPKSPPYYKGRFSNGPVWVENLYETYFPNGKAENFLDFAVGGAGAVLSYKENMPYTLDTEVDNYLYLHNYTKKDTSLFIIWIGANNYLNGPSNVDAITSSVVDAIGNDIKSLIDHGAVMFMVVNLPDLGKTPSAAKEKNQTLLTELTNQHNQKLLNKVNELKEKYPNVNLALFDVNTVFNQVINDPQQFTITNTADSCYNGGMTLQARASQTMKMEPYLTQQTTEHHLVLDEKTKQAILENPSLREALTIGYQSGMKRQLTDEAASCDNYLFWDSVHPTAVLHRLIAQYAKSTLDMAGFQPINPY